MTFMYLSGAALHLQQLWRIIEACADTNALTYRKFPAFQHDQDFIKVRR